MEHQGIYHQCTLALSEKLPTFTSDDGCPSRDESAERAVDDSEKPLK